MSLTFLDTNIFLRHLTGTPSDQALRATAYFEKIERGEIKVVTTYIVLFEAVFTLARTYKLNKEQIRDALLPLFELPNIHIEGKRKLRKIFQIYIKKNISFVDAYHTVLMETKKIDEVVSFDRDFDRIEDIKRIEP
jgi:uncharacterized protein